MFWGDSLAADGLPPYPDLLAERLANRGVEVEVANLAAPGTDSADWAPGGEHFESGLREELAAGDVFVVTVGGNDLEAAVGGIDGPDALSRAVAAADALREAEDRIGDNLRRAFREIRRERPGARIAYVSYPDYSKSAAWREAAGTAGAIALRAGLEALNAGAAGAGADTVVDLLDVTARAGVDGLLSDSEHLGPAGHELYARKLARALRR